MRDTRPILIIGQGISGSLVAWFLLKHGANVLVIDPCESSTASRVAAGLIHPVTGRRLVKTWMADTLIPFARSTYTEIEDKIASRFFEDYPVFERFHSAGHRNDWAAKSVDPGLQAYVGEECSAETSPQGIRAPFGGRWLIGCGWLDTIRFLDAMRTYLERMKSFKVGRIDYASLHITEAGVDCDGESFKLVIDCTGVAAFHQPLLGEIGLNPCSGELLHLNSNSIPRDVVIHGRMKVIPLGGYSYLAGATYRLSHIGNEISQEGKAEICSALDELIEGDYSIGEQICAVRPSSLDRRPIIGKHNRLEHTYLFNGMGSKGVMLAPWFASKLSAHLLHGEELPEEVFPYRHINKP
jgi:glycine/D-amino acid oxidase-like deaminating enzyme